MKLNELIASSQVSITQIKVVMKQYSRKLMRPTKFYPTQKKGETMIPTDTIIQEWQTVEVVLEDLVLI